MTDADPLDDKISDQAIDWLVLLHSGDATAADRAAFCQWRAADPRHDSAAREAEALWGGLGETHAAREVRTPPLAVMRASVAVRGRRMVLAGALAASVVLAVGGLSRMVHPRDGEFATATGEVMRVRLPDGSVAILNTNSALSVEYSSSERRLALREGEALFEVVKDPGRPFLVEAAGGTARAVGTIYGVRLRGSGAEVTVAEGVVAVSAPTGDRQRLEAGQHAAYRPDAGMTVRRVDVASEMAWRRGKLIFNRRPLGEVMDELERYLHGSIVVADKDLRGLEVTGVFTLDDPDGLFRSLKDSLHVRVVRLPLLTVVY